MFNSLFTLFSKKQFSNDFFKENNFTYEQKQELVTKNYAKEFLDIEKSRVLATYYYHVCAKIDSLLFHTAGIRQDNIEILPGYFGREFNKSPSILFVSDRKKALPVFIDVVQGSGLILCESFDKEKRIILHHVKTGDKILIPHNYAVIFVNTSIVDFRCSIFLESSASIKFGVLSSFYGGTIYVIEKGFIKNENASTYYVLKESEGTHLNEYSFDKDDSLYRQFIALPEKFYFLKRDED